MCIVKKKVDDRSRQTGGGIEGIFTGLGDLLGKLGELAEKGEKLQRSGEINFKGGEKGLKGVYGFSVKMGMGGEGVKVEPFGNIRKDQTTGQSTVQELREPIVDVFEEKDFTLILAEMPGIAVEDIHLDVKDDLVTIQAERGDKKYRKEILLTRSYPREKMVLSCNNGVLEIKCIK